jgi:UDP-N-acetyl-D-mannosaminuronate dehydrogenase
MMQFDGRLHWPDFELLGSLDRARVTGADIETIGVIGDGKIGLPICERLLNSGDRVIGYGRSAGKDLVDDIDVGASLIDVSHRAFLSLASAMWRR